jgi:hypothetical protein
LYWYACQWGCLFCWLVVARVGFGLTSKGPLLHDPGTLVPIGTSEAGFLVAACSSPYFVCLWVVGFLFAGSVLVSVTDCAVPLLLLGYWTCPSLLVCLFASEYGIMLFCLVGYWYGYYCCP